MHVLVTRPETDADDVSARLEALGVTVSKAPLIEIELNAIPVDAITTAAGLIATSRNGLRSLARSPVLGQSLTKPLFAVGSATADLARDLGFTDVRVGNGTAASLVPVIVGSQAEFGRGPLVHLAGDHLAFDLRGALAATTVNLTVVPAYRSIAAKALSPGNQKALAAGAIDAVILMSPRSAQIWGTLVSDAGLQKNSQKLTYVCLSKAVADTLQLPSRAKVKVADNPSSLEIVALIRALAADFVKE